jgi:hypothetical protein
VGASTEDLEPETHGRDARATIAKTK